MTKTEENIRKRTSICTASIEKVSAYAAYFDSIIELGQKVKVGLITEDEAVEEVLKRHA